MKVDNVKKDNLDVDLATQLKAIVPERVIPPTWLLVDDDVFAKLMASSAPQSIKEGYIAFNGWKVISRGNLVEVG